MDDLVGHAYQFAKLPLGQTAPYSALTDAHTDVPIGAGLFIHVRAPISVQTAPGTNHISDKAARKRRSSRLSRPETMLPGS
jgi:hypothetical protein